MNVGRVYLDFQQQSLGINQQVALAPLHLLATIVATRPPLCVVLADWLSMTAALGVGSLPERTLSFSLSAVFIASQMPSLRQTRSTLKYVPEDSLIPPLALQQRFAPLVSHFEEQKVPLGYSFVPYKFGPFSKEVYEDLEALEREMLVVRPKRGKNVERPETAIEQEAAEDVKQILETVPQDKKQSVDELMQRYGSMGFEQLLDYVYAKYPQFAVGRKQKRS